MEGQGLRGAAACHFACQLSLHLITPHFQNFQFILELCHDLMDSRLRSLGDLVHHLLGHLWIPIALAQCNLVHLSPEWSDVILPIAGCLRNLCWRRGWRNWTRGLDFGQEGKSGIALLDSDVQGKQAVLGLRVCDLFPGLLYISTLTTLAVLSRGGRTVEENVQGGLADVVIVGVCMGLKKLWCRG